ncbi:hypothetical protein D1J51_13505 [Leucobacter sp. wl10]|nr:hypothetical protein D1J51_13505 [Leucobacter sp. wl10]
MNIRRRGRPRKAQTDGCSQPRLRRLVDECRRER